MIEGWAAEAEEACEEVHAEGPGGGEGEDCINYNHILNILWIDLNDIIPHIIQRLQQFIQTLLNNICSFDDLYYLCLFMFIFNIQTIECARIIITLVNLEFEYV